MAGNGKPGRRIRQHFPKLEEKKMGLSRWVVASKGSLSKMRASSHSRNPKRGEASSAADERPVPEPIWKAPQETGSITVTPCQPVELRLMAVRIVWEPSSFDEESTRKNIYLLCFARRRDP